MDFVGLKIAGVVIVALAGVGIYKRVKANWHKYNSVDDLVKSVDPLLQKFEAAITAKTIEVNNYVVQGLGIEKLRQEAEAELQKAKDYLAKIKAVL